MNNYDWINNNSGYYTMADDNLSNSETITLDISDTDTITFPTDYNFDFSAIDLGFNPGIDVTQGDIAVHNDGDIKLGERSLKQFMDKVDERLNILQPNPELEAEWDELKRLGEQYRKMEQELLEKNKMWEKLKEQ